MPHRRRVAIVFAAIVYAAGATAGERRVAQWAPFKQQSGEALYDAVCRGCHMPGGVGAPGAYPALAHNPKLETAVYPLYFVLYGRKGMPPFAPRLNDAQIAAVINYVRTHFGNAYADALTPVDVAAARP
jgi:mono/diheme cytochrome c family protein